MKLPEFSVNRKVTAAMLVMILVVVGTISLSRLGLDFFPDIDFPTVSVITTYRGASSSDIEATISKLLEQVISSVNRIKKVTSQTSEGVSVIQAEFEWGTNLDFAAQDIRDQIGLYRTYLPKDASDPLVVKFNLNQFPIIMFGVNANMPTFGLKKLMEDEVAPRLERLDGVAAAQVFSMDTREILVDIDKTALESRNLTLDQVLMALPAGNLNLPAGNLVERHSELLVRTLGEFKSLDDIRRAFVGSSSKGEPVFLEDIAEIKDTIKETRFEARIGGKKGVFMMIVKRSGANTAIAGDAVNKEIALLKKTLPPHVEFLKIMDQSEMVKVVTKRTVDNAWQGGLLAIILIFAFLVNWRPTLIIGLAIPLSIITTFIAFYAAGYTLNLLTLGGLALGVGMLVDNAIVVIENTFRHIEEGDSSSQAAVVGASEVGMAITASTLTTIVVFLPLVFATGITAKLTRGLALAIAFSLISSLFVALTVVPLLSSLLFKGKDKIQKSGSRLARFKWMTSWQGFQGPRNLYRRLLASALRHRGRVLAIVIGVFVLSLAIIPFLGTEFMPVMDQDMLFIKVSLPVGTALEETNRAVTLVENLLAQEPGVKIVTAQAGSQAESNPQDSAMGTSTTGSHEGILFVGLESKDKRRMTANQILEKIRKKLPKIKDTKFESLNISSSVFGGAQTPIDIKLYGKDLDLLKQLADRAVSRIRNVPGLRDATHTLAKAKPEYHIRINREKSSQLGLTVGQVGNAVQAATLGKVATRFRDANEEVDIRVRFKQRFRDSIDEIKNIPLLNPLNKTVYLEQVSTVERGEGPIQITRENQTRRVSITGNIVGRDLGSVVKDIRQALAGLERELPQGYFLEYGGAYEQMVDAFKILIAAFALATLLVYMVMASQFESFLYPFIIMFTVPLGLIGVVLGLLIAGNPVNLPVWIGFILLEGIAVNNGIVMIDYFNQLKKRGVEKKEAILLGATTRLRAVLLTALTTVLGMLPMAISTSSGYEMRAPMAITVVGGLTATTFLTLFIIPIIYSLFDKVSFKEK